MTVTTGKPSIIVDGLNLGLPKGTGIATYGRTLLRALSDSFDDVGLLYGFRVPKRERILPPEIAVLDDKSWNSGPGGPRRKLRRGIDALRALRGFDAYRVELSGAVDLAPLAGRLTLADLLYNGSELYEIADAHFRLFRRLMPIRIHPAPPQVMHWTAPIPARVVGARNIYTIHDLIPLRLPYATTNDKTLFRVLLDRIAAEADHILTVSEFSRSDILALMAVAPEKVTNCYQSVDVPPLAMVQAQVDGFIAERFALSRKGFFLFVGAIEPKKNLKRLLEAYIAADTALPLVVVGQRAWQWEGELSPLGLGSAVPPPVCALGNGKRVLFLDHVAPLTLRMLQDSARALVFPSLYEGFGLPVIEAMAAGAATLTASRTSTAEVAGEAALLVDPLDTAAIRAGLEQLAGDDALVQRLEGAGLKQAASFSPQEYSRRMRAFYEDTMGVAPTR